MDSLRTAARAHAKGPEASACPGGLGWRRCAGIVALSVILAACGGGGSDGGTNGSGGGTAQPQARPVEIAFDPTAGAAQQLASGFVHGVSASAPSQYLVDGLAVRFLRGADHHPVLPSLFDLATYSRAKAVGAQLMIGTHHYTSDRNHPHAAYRPGDGGDHETYKRIVTGVLQEGRAKGYDIYSWITWSEPDIEFAGQGRSFEQYLAAHKAAYDAIKAFDPGYRVQGPELSSFNLPLLQQFLLFCKANNCLPELLTWHETGAAPADLETRLRSLRQFMVDNAITPMAMAITRYQGGSPGSPSAGTVGDNVAWLAQLERASALGLTAALVSGAEQPESDPRFAAALGPTTSTDGSLPRGLWWNYSSYRDMVGTRLHVRPGPQALDALGAVDTVRQRAVLLVGNQATTAMPVHLSLQGLAGSALAAGGHVRVQARLIPEGPAAVTALRVVFDGEVQVADGQARVVLPHLPAKAAYRVDVLPPMAALSPPLLLEAESLTPTASTVRYENLSDPRASGGGTGVLLATAAGDSVSFQLTVPASGVYNLRLALKRDPSRGIGQLYVNGRPAGPPIDGYGPAQVDWADFGGVPLQAGPNEFKFVVVGKRQESAGYQFGIDRVELARHLSGSAPVLEQPETTRLEAVGPADRLLAFQASGPGVAKHLLMGVDTAWFDANHVRQSIWAAGSEYIDVVRVSYFTDLPLVEGQLHPTVKERLDARLATIAMLGRPMNLVMNSVRMSADPSYGTPGRWNPVTWAANIAATLAYYEAAGHKVTVVYPCNECDLGTQFGNNDMPFQAALNRELRKLPQLNGVMISTSTLNTDPALRWYLYLKDTVEAGNTHQLAGSFDNYAGFFTTVRNDGKYATNDEMHNIMEGMVGAEYGLQLGVYWGGLGLARGEFTKAVKGMRLGYAEHRPNWTAAAVYRQPNGKVQLFGGASERQALETRYQVVALDRDVYYKGRGPTREYGMLIPGGTGYQANQENSEQVVDVTWGDDIPPPVNNQRYVIVNKASARVLAVADGSTANGALIQQVAYTGALSQQWDLAAPPVAEVNNPDVFTLRAAHSGRALHLGGYSFNDGASIFASTLEGTRGSGNQRWYFDHVGDGWFRLCSHYSAKCLEAANAATTEGSRIEQWQRRSTSNQHQLWRLLPVGAPIEFVAPASPAFLTAAANAHSVVLRWVASTSSDVASYTVLRATAANGPYETIARDVKKTAFVDKSVAAGQSYFYQVQAVDGSLNKSVRTAAVQASPTGAPGPVLHYAFDGNSDDSTQNQNHATLAGLAGLAATYPTGRQGAALAIAGNEYLQLPYTSTHHQAITVASWLRWQGGTAEQRIFDFGNGAAESMSLTPSSRGGRLRLSIKSGGVEQVLEAPSLTVDEWTHVAVTLDATGARLYVNGRLAAESAAITLTPQRIKPVLNYVGRSQNPSDPLYRGQLDEFVVYNHALNASQITRLVSVGVER